MSRRRRPRQINGWVIGIMVGIVAIVGGLYTVNQPAYKVRQYVKAVNNQEFEKAYGLFCKDDTLGEVSLEKMVSYMEKTFDSNQFITMDRPEKINDTNSYKVNSKFVQGEKIQIITAVESEDQWYIQNPFPVETVTIYAPTGAAVSFNGQPLNENGNGVYKVEQVLPGQYTVQMQFAEDNVEDYVEQISVPQITEVISPYQMMGVSIVRPLNRVVTLGGEEKINTEGVVNFPNRIEGKYTLEINDPYGNAKPYSKEIMINEANRVFEVKDFRLTQQGITHVQQFIATFYNAYLTGIKTGDDSFLYDYVEGVNQGQIADEFKQWYVNDKQIIDATLVIELEELYMDEEGMIHVNLMEIAELVNKEEKSTNGKGIYKVITNWGIILEPKGNDYKVIQKDLKQSIVSYKDEKGKWIAY